MRFSSLFSGDKKIVVSNYFSLFTLQVANYILPLIILPFLVRKLGTDKFGLIMFAQSLVLFFNVFVDFGFNLSGTREISVNQSNKSEVSKIFSSIVSIKMLLTIIAFVIFYILVVIIPRLSLDLEVYIYSFGIVIGQAIFPIWFFQGIEKMRLIAVLNIISKLIFTVLLFIFIKGEKDYLLVPIFNSLGYILGGMIGLIIALKFTRFTKPINSICTRLLKESSSLFVANFAVSLYNASNILILGFFTNNVIVGIYASMEKLILAAKNIYVPLYQALYPWVAKQKEMKKSDIIKKWIMPISIIGLGISMGIFLFSNTILEIIYNDKSISEYSYVLQILSFIALFSGLNMLFNTLYFPAIKRYKVRMNILIVGGLFNLIFGFLFTWIYGINGIAVVVLITEMILFILGFFFFKKLKNG